MELDLVNAELRARDYIGTSDTLPRLGWGIGGFVYLSPNAQTAIKVHRRREGYETEVKAYKLLARAKVTGLLGLNVPKLRGKDDTLMTFHMDVVSSPYLLDFAGVSFIPPDFPADVMDDWHARIHDFFGANASVAYSVYDSLKKLGIWYLDLRPSNLKLDGLPGLKAGDSPPLDTDDFKD